MCGSSSSLAPRPPARAPAQEADKHAESLDGDLNEVRCQPSAAPTHMRARGGVVLGGGSFATGESGCDADCRC